MSGVEKNIVAQAKRFGRPIPDRIKNKPRLLPGLSFFMTSFYELQSDRPVGLGWASIPWSSLHAYAQSMQLTQTEYEDFMFLVRQLDNGYIAHMRDKGSNGEST